MKLLRLIFHMLVGIFLLKSAYAQEASSSNPFLQDNIVLTDIKSVERPPGIGEDGKLEKILLPETTPKSVKAMIVKGDKLYLEGMKKGDIASIQKAMPHYLTGSRRLGVNIPLLDYRIGVCYLYSYDPYKAMGHFKRAKASGLDFNKGVRSYFYAKSLHMELEFDSAIVYYQTMLSPWKYNLTERQKMLAQVAIEQCRVGKQMIKHPQMVTIEPMGEDINTKYPEYGPVFDTTRGGLLLFTSRRPRNIGRKRDKTGYYFEDIYSSEFNSKTGSFLRAKNIGRPVNTEEHDAIVAISYDGGKMLVFKDINGGDLYFSEKDEYGVWSEPEPTPMSRINTPYNESVAAFSPDGKYLYFVSNNPSITLGGYDIFVAEWNEKKRRFVKPIRLDTNVNTQYDERSVFVTADGNTIYFACNGPTSMGGYDVFKSVKKDSGFMFSKPENVGYPINTAGDDIFFTLDQRQKYAYYSSTQRGSIGSTDIFRVDLDPTVVVVQQGYRDLGDRRSKPQHLSLESQRSAVIELMGSNELLTTVEFDFAKATLRKSAYPKLKKAVEYMDSNPEALLLISGHTDNVGSYAYNMELSRKRATVVRNYLVNEGKVKGKRLVVKYFGKTQPLADNTSAQGRQKNRRVEIKKNRSN